MILTLYLAVFETSMYEGVEVFGLKICVILPSNYPEKFPVVKHILQGFGKAPPLIKAVLGPVMFFKSNQVI